MPGRRRRVEGNAKSFGRVGEDRYISLAPTINRFAEDTSMLGFRYLHTKYKIGFRIFWGILITFFLGLTIYQVLERIGYYFVRNPLNTQRSYDSPTRVPFPTVLLCNKLQMKASRIAEHNPNLLRTMALMYNEDGSPSLSQEVADSIESLDDDFFRIYQSSLQRSEDFFLSCHYGRGQSCMDEIHPVFTPSGLCFAVNSNITVERPGPETTLSMLLNLETYEMVPGWVMEPGVVISMYDRQVPQTAYSGEGMHLGAGKVVTIPINDIRKLHRHSSKCGKIRIGDFREKDYSRVGCQWHKNYDTIARTCGCIPKQSPKNMETILKREAFCMEQLQDKLYMLKSSLGTSETAAFINNSCTLKAEFHCAGNISKEAEIEMEMQSREQCPEDCSEITYTTIVFGNHLDVSEIASYLPSDWEEDKEKRLNDFQVAFDILPNGRIPLIRSIQKQADEAQQFLNEALKLLEITEKANEVVLPCLVNEVTYNITGTIAKLHANEPIWNYLASYIEFVFPFQMGSIFSLLHIDVEDDHLLKFLDFNHVKQTKFDKTTLDEKVRNAVHDIDLYIQTANQSEGIFGSELLDIQDQEALRAKLTRLFASLKDCILAENKSEVNRTNITSLLQTKCGEGLNEHYSSFCVGRNIPKVLSMETFSHYASTVEKLSEVLKNIKWNAKPKIFSWQNFDINLRLFEALYRENGNDTKTIYDLLRHRKMIQSDIGQQISEATLRIENALESRLKLLEDLQLQPAAIDPVNSIRNSLQCLQNLSNAFDSLKKANFLRSEWTSRLQGLITVAKSYSPGKQYDEVNLLFVKIYFAHFKQEIITQERSYSLFLLLAEIGGTIGLYVGASLLTIAETAVFFIEKRTRKNYDKRRRLSSKNSSNFPSDA